MIRRFMLATMLVMFPTVMRAQAAPAALSEAVQPGVVRGTVLSKETGEPLAYAIIKIESLGIEQFTNRQGRFNLIQIKPGKYRINVRQLGYSPANIDITVSANSGQDVNVQMDRIVTKLATYTVRDKQECVTPGRPKAADDPQLAQMFEQLEQSAVRLRLLAKEFPYLVSTERRSAMIDTAGVESVEALDVITMPGQTEVEYQPGKVVRRVLFSQTYAAKVPTMLDFAAEKFIANHCFALSGVESDGEGNGEKFVRIDFTASKKINDPDVEGSVFLDTADFHLRRSDIRLTRVPSSLREVGAIEIRTRFREYVPGMPIVGLVDAVTELKKVQGLHYRFTKRTEQQLLVGLTFTKQRPDSMPVPPMLPPH